MKVCKIVVFLLTFLNGTFSQCPEVEEDSKMRVDTFFTLQGYAEQINYLDACVRHFLKCEYYEEAIKWEWNKYIVARDFSKYDAQYAFLYSMEHLLDSLDQHLSYEFQLEFNLQNLISWSEYHSNSGFYRKSTAVLEKSAALMNGQLDTLTDGSVRNLTYSYGDLGDYYLQQRKFQLAIQYYERASKVAEYREKDNHRLSNIALYKGKTASCLMKSGDMERARKMCLEHLLLSRNLYEIHTKYDGYLKQAYTNMAEWHVINNNLDSAIVYVDLMQELESIHNRPKTKSVTLRSKIHLEMGNRDGVRKLLNQHLSSYGTIEEAVSKMKKTTSFIIADLLIKSRDLDAAREVLTQIDRHFIDKKNGYKSLGNIKLEVPNFDSLQLLIYELSLPENKEISTFTASSKKAQRLVKSGLESISENSDKVTFLRKSMELSEKILERTTKFSSDDHDLSFSAIESSKAMVLINEWRKNQLINRKQDDDLFSEELSLQSSLNSLSNAYLSATDTIEMAELSQLLRDAHKQFQLIKRQLKVRYPNYYTMKYKWSPPSLKEVQSQLLPGETFVNYLEGEESLYVLVFTESYAELAEIDSVKQVKKLIDNYSKALISKDEESMQHLDYYSNKLYDLLIDPFSQHLDEHLIISPSGSLAQIPFAALYQESGKQDNYLLARHSITYVPSATFFFQERKSKKKRSIKKALFVAPAFEPQPSLSDQYAMRSSHGELFYNVPEVENIALNMPSTILANENATKDEFIKQLKNKDIIHLATHAKSNNDSPDKSYIAFYQEQKENDNHLLYLNELSQLYMPVKMIVLSACETGLGKIYKGEGTMSLANRCFYAGAESVLATLWSVQDRTTFDIVTSFYHYLEQGYSKNHALQQAQKDFLNNNFEEFHHPYYWAGYTIIGNNEPLIFRRKNRIINTSIVLGSFMAISLGLLYRKRFLSVFSSSN